MANHKLNCLRSNKVRVVSVPFKYVPSATVATFSNDINDLLTISRTSQGLQVITLGEKPSSLEAAIVNLDVISAIPAAVVGATVTAYDMSAGTVTITTWSGTPATPWDFGIDEVHGNLLLDYSTAD